MSRDSGSEDPSKRTVAELLAEHGGGGSQRNARRRRRRAEDPTETAPQTIIDRVVSDSGRMRPIPAEEEAAEGTTDQQQPPATEEAQSPPASPVPQSEPEGADNTEGAPAPQPDADFWARRFSAAGSAPEGERQPEHDTGRRAAAPAPSESEITVQQPALPKRPARGQGPVTPAPPRAVSNESPTQAVPIPPVPEDGPPRVGDTFTAQGNTVESTEQFPPVEGTLAPEATASADVAAPPAYPPEGQGSPALEDDSEDPYDSLSYEADHDVYTADYDDFDDDDGDYDDFDDDVDDAYDPDLPAGMDAEDYLEDEAEEEESERTPVKEWLLLITQGGVGLLTGGLVWLGFRWLWTVIPLAALIAAVIIIGALVFIARRFLRTDDLQTVLLAVLVGLICTVSPAALLLIGY
ncbi:hypothetical protein FHX42_004557 [Saccharopolyspora lacisalsi]|uniref:Transmembrane protein n=1 Tax=Halosaccharopolyspora lacisalsi TaxID=1000566 RepID=A0A839E1M3_9PSEU|nr:hypothetical protein [Halosaccharopolyspora lacisalsi]MBA8827173.1 hypothetical protein [Halosaccharopolyspora lacisalsi]